MIISKQKKIEDLLKIIGNDSVFIVGCSDCATLCHTGGEDEVRALKDVFEKEHKHVIGWIILISFLMFFLSSKLLFMQYFDRIKARKLIGSHYMINFALVPIMLMSQNPWIGLLAGFPALGFILSNLTLHGTLLQPKTM